MIRISTYILALGLAALGIGQAWRIGWLHLIVIYDPSHLSIVVASLALLGTVWVGLAIAGRAKVEPVKFIGSMAVAIGLLSTLIGIAVMTVGIDPSTATTPAGAADNVAALIAGLGVAVLPSVLGTITSIWLMLLARLVP